MVERQSHAHHAVRLWRTGEIVAGGEHRLLRLWRRLCWPSVMRDADLLIKGHAAGAYRRATTGATACSGVDGFIHWSRVASEIERRQRGERRDRV